MPPTLSILIAEDSPDDVMLIADELKRRGVKAEFERVDTAERMGRALDHKPWDIVIGDFTIPGFGGREVFGGMEALRLAHECDPDLPFIMVTGTISDETAVEAMKAGAQDYVLKENLTRLGAAITREVLEAGVRREHRKAVEARRALLQRAAFLAEASRKLSSLLSYDEVLNQASRVPLGEVADWCVLSVVDGVGGRFHTVLSHVDPFQEDRAREFLVRYPLDPSASAGAGSVVRTGRFEETSPQTVLVALAPQSATADLVAALGHDSGLCLPLVARGQMLGAMTLVRTRRERPLTADDAEFCRELATRTAIALDNALLYRRACEGIRARDEFLTIASHEFNTPLASLALHLDQLLRPTELGPCDYMPPRAIAALSRARGQVDRLSELVGNLLDVIATQEPELHIRDVDLLAITREVVRKRAPECARAGCDVAIEGPAHVFGRWDPARIAKLVSNLLSNAYKYGPGKPIEISIRTEGTLARLAVRDHGIGIPPADLERVFGRFERASSARHYGGLGLGLYIASRIVEAHGGTLSVKSQLSEGSTFSVELPLNRTDIALNMSRGRQADPHPVVDDNPGGQASSSSATHQPAPAAPEPRPEDPSRTEERGQC
jgi:signal transduction histidine kinase/CheY-like chemotaxis protein